MLHTVYDNLSCDCLKHVLSYLTILFIILFIYLWEKIILKLILCQFPSSECTWDKSYTCRSFIFLNPRNSKFPEERNLFKNLQGPSVHFWHVIFLCKTEKWEISVVFWAVLRIFASIYGTWFFCPLLHKNMEKYFSLSFCK